MKVLRARAEIRAEYEAKIKDIKSKQWVSVEISLAFYKLKKTLFSTLII